MNWRPLPTTTRPRSKLIHEFVTFQTVFCWTERPDRVLLGSLSLLPPPGLVRPGRWLAALFHTNPTKVQIPSQSRHPVWTLWTNLRLPLTQNAWCEGTENCLTPRPTTDKNRTKHRQYLTQTVKAIHNAKVIQQWHCLGTSVRRQRKGASVDRHVIGSCHVGYRGREGAVQKKWGMCFPDGDATMTEAWLQQDALLLKQRGLKTIGTNWQIYEWPFSGNATCWHSVWVWHRDQSVQMRNKLQHSLAMDKFNTVLRSCSLLSKGISRNWFLTFKQITWEFKSIVKRQGEMYSPRCQCSWIRLEICLWIRTKYWLFLKFRLQCSCTWGGSFTLSMASVPVDFWKKKSANHSLTKSDLQPSKPRTRANGQDKAWSASIWLNFFCPTLPALSFFCFFITSGVWFPFWSSTFLERCSHSCSSTAWVHSSCRQTSCTRLSFDRGMSQQWMKSRK